MATPLDTDPRVLRAIDREPERAGVRPLGFDLAEFGGRTAIFSEAGETSYAELARRVAAAADRIGPGRRLVLLAASNDVESVIAYLAALAGGHPMLLAPGDNPAATAELTAAYDPDVVVRPHSGRWRYEHRRAGSAHDPHPDLALLLSTSGSTGSPKLVRLSHANLRANAEAIATYLAIRPTDRAATTLPVSYCYGLSVVNSHLLRGAALVLTDRSVADDAFWTLFRRARGTAFAGVPYTFTLLDRVGFDAMRLPHLRYVTQAGGRLDPDRVRHYADLGRRRGWDLFVMYGQTEATARMAYLPPELAVTRPTAIGVPVPGGSFRLDPLDDVAGTDTGELVYRGPNVMLGYAESPADLALGRTVDELRTGDLARRAPDGLYEIVGRGSRFVKVFGLRIDLDGLESWLGADGVPALCVAAPGQDSGLGVVVARAAGDDADHPADHDAEAVRRRVAGRCGVPARCVRVVTVADLPRLPSGKPDHVAATDLVAAADPAAATDPSTDRATDRAQDPATDPAGADPAPSDPVTDLCALYAEVLDRADVTSDSSFVSLGGDSLSYVEMSVRLEEMLGALPADWHAVPIRDLAAPRPRRPADRRRPWLRWMDTSVVLRAASIVLIVGSHIGVFTVRGGAALLLAVAGFNVARFQLTAAGPRARARHLAASVARVAVPSMILIGAMWAVTDAYGWANVLLLNEAIGPRYGTERHFWFLETLVYITVALLLVLWVPAVDRWERRHPFAVALVALGLGLTVRYDVVDLDFEDNLTTPATWFWLFALGWAVGKAAVPWQRWLVTAAVTVTVYDHAGNPLRETIVTVGLVLLIWAPRLPSPAVLHRAIGVLAGASLSIFLTHWHVYPYVAPHSRVGALAAALGAGVLYGAVVDRVMARCSAFRFDKGDPRAFLPVPNRRGDAPRWSAARRCRGVRRGRAGGLVDRRRQEVDDLQWTDRGAGQAGAGEVHAEDRHRRRGPLREQCADGRPAAGGG